MKKGGYKSKSDFLQRKQLKWSKRSEMREFFKNRSKIKSGEIIEEVREEEDKDICSGFNACCNGKQYQR